jgi:hypothetical protein
MDNFNFAAWAGHTFSGMAIFGSFFGLFPPIAAIVAFIWYVIQIYESMAVQAWISSHRLRKIAALKVEMARLLALELIAHPANRVDILPARLAAEELLSQARAEAKKLIDDAMRVTNEKKTFLAPESEGHA